MESVSRPMWCGSLRREVSIMTVVFVCISGISLVLLIGSVATADNCKCVKTKNEEFAMYHVILAAAIPIAFLAALLDGIELFYESKTKWQFFKFISSLVSAALLLAGVYSFATDYEKTFAPYSIPQDMFKRRLGWSFFMCAVVGAAMTVATVCHIVIIIWRKRRSGTELSIQSGDAVLLIQHDVQSLEGSEAGSVPPDNTREIPTQ